MVLRAILVGLLAIAVMAIPGSDRVHGQGGTWTTKASMPTARAWFGAVVVNGILYAVGGFNNTSVAKVFNTVEAYDPGTDTWSTKAPMPTSPRWLLGVGVVNGILYAVGGRVFSLGAVPTVEAYDPSTDTWSTKAAIPTARWGLGVGVVNGILYAVGGFNPSSVSSNTVEAYDPGTNTWTTKAPMPTGRAELGVGVVNDVLYAVGGYGSSGSPNTVEAYDPSTDTWSTKAPIPAGRCCLGVGVVNGILYAVGGIVSDGYSNTVEAYDPSTDTWSTSTPMPTARCCLGAGVVNGILYVVGGSNTSGFLTTNEAFTPPTTGNTPTGRNVMVTPVDTTTNTSPVTLTFQTVTQGGNTTLTTSTQGPPPPSGFKLGQPPTYYNLTTTATFSGPIQVCINYSGIGFHNPSQLKLYHLESGVWVNQTVSLDTTTQIICASVTSLSPFLIVEPTPFGAFSADVHINQSSSSFTVKGDFTLGAGGSIDPQTQNVTFQLGGFSTTIPAGSFTQKHNGTFQFEGIIDGAPVDMTIQPHQGGYEFTVDGAGVSNLPTSNPVTVSLTIGNTTGSTQVNAHFSGQ